MIGQETSDAKGLQQGFKLQKNFVSAMAKDIRQDFPCPMIEGMPQPAGLFLFPHKTPHFIDLCGLYSANAYCHGARMQAIDEGSMYRREGRPLFFNS